MVAFSDLSLQEKVVLGYIVTQYSNGISCQLTNSFFGQLLNVSNKRASEIINDLVDKNLLISNIDQANGNNRVLVPNMNEVYNIGTKI